MEATAGSPTCAPVKGSPEGLRYNDPRATVRGTGVRATPRTAIPSNRHMLADLRYAVRLLLKQPAFTLIAIVRARARHRREHGHFQRGRRRAAAAAAVRATRSGWCTLSHLLAQDRRARHGLGAGLPRLARSRDELRRHGGVHARRDAGQRRRRRRLRRGDACHAGILPAVRCRTPSRAAADRRRAARRRSAHRRRQPRVLDVAPRRRPGGARAHAEVRPAPLHHRRRAAAGRSASRPTPTSGRRGGSCRRRRRDRRTTTATVAPAQGRRHARAGAIGDGRDCRRGSSGRIPESNDSKGVAVDRAPRADGAQRAHDADADLRRRRRRAADRVRQRQQPAARARLVAHERAGRSARRSARAAAESSASSSPRACCSRRSPASPAC